MPRSPPAKAWEPIVTFHKLTQWLCYSLMVPMTKLLNVRFAGAELMTGLPEYRNGGLLVDTGLLTLKEEAVQRGLKNYHDMVGNGPAGEVVPTFEPGDDVIVEWRAVTVGFLDELLAAVNKGLGLEGSEQLTLAQMLEAGTWKVRMFRFLPQRERLTLAREDVRSPKYRGPSPKVPLLVSFRMELCFERTPLFWPIHPGGVE